MKLGSFKLSSNILNNVIIPAAGAVRVKAAAYLDLGYATGTSVSSYVGARASLFFTSVNNRYEDVGGAKNLVKGIIRKLRFAAANAGADMQRYPSQVNDYLRAQLEENPELADSIKRFLRRMESFAETGTFVLAETLAHLTGRDRVPDDALNIDELKALLERLEHLGRQAQQILDANVENESDAEASNGEVSNDEVSNAEEEDQPEPVNFRERRAERPLIEQRRQCEQLAEKKRKRPGQG